MYFRREQLFVCVGGEIWVFQFAVQIQIRRFGKTGSDRKFFFLFSYLLHFQSFALLASADFGNAQRKAKGGGEKNPIKGVRQVHDIRVKLKAASPGLN